MRGERAKDLLLFCQVPFETTKTIWRQFDFIVLQRTAENCSKVRAAPELTIIFLVQSTQVLNLCLFVARRRR